MGDRVVVGEKGTTSLAGMHVPLIANWPGRVLAGKVHADLIDSTDFLPTLLDAAGINAKSGAQFDSRSFLPQLRGEKGQPRDWIYSWYSPRQGADTAVREFAFDRRYKLYRSGDFFDLGNDAEEKRPLAVASLKGEAALAARRLQSALDQFKGRPPACGGMRVAPCAAHAVNG
jgi:arylsulfatase A